MWRTICVLLALKVKNGGTSKEMATLLELATIEEESTLPSTGSPVDPGTPQALRARIKTLLYRKAFAYMEATPSPQDSDEIAQLAFAQQVLRNPESQLGAVFRLLLAEADVNDTVEEILAATDTQLDTVMTQARLATLAKGLRVG